MHGHQIVAWPSVCTSLFIGDLQHSIFEQEGSFASISSHAHEGTAILGHRVRSRHILILVYTISMSWYVNAAGNHKHNQVKQIQV